MDIFSAILENSPMKKLDFIVHFVFYSSHFILFYFSNEIK